MMLDMNSGETLGAYIYIYIPSVLLDTEFFRVLTSRTMGLAPVNALLDSIR